MTGASKEPAWDVLVVVTSGRAVGHGQRLRDHLERRGLRAKLHVVLAPRFTALPSETDRDARRAAFCVVLTAVRGADETADEITYVAFPKPAFLGQLPILSPKNPQEAARAIEAGRITGDVSSLAERVAARIANIGG